MQKLSNNKHILDKKDQKILFALDINSRASNVQIGRQTRMAHDVVKYRIDRLRKWGVLEGFYAEIDPFTLGKQVFRILLRFHNIDVNAEQSIIDSLAEDPRVLWTITSHGNWDLLMGIMVDDNFEFFEYQQEFFNKYGSFIEKKMISLYHRMNIYRRDYLVGKREQGAPVYMGSQKSIKLDKLDESLLSLLLLEARMPLHEIALKLKQSSKVIAYRIKRLVRLGVILGFRPLISLPRIGYSWFKIHLQLHNLDMRKRAKMVEFISKHPNVVFIDEMIGGYDMELDVHWRTNIELRSFVNTLRSMFSDLIKDFETLELYEIHKYA